jgi:hypothetical protein
MSDLRRLGTVPIGLYANDGAKLGEQKMEVWQALVAVPGTDLRVSVNVVEYAPGQWEQVRYDYTTKEHFLFTEWVNVADRG